MLRKLIAVAALCFAPAAFALNNRSAVSITGLDTNPCTTTSPCRTFSAALTATIADGEIIAMTSGGYGAFNIDKGITVSGIPGVHAAITASAGDVITIYASPGINVTLRNLVLLNSASAPIGSNGIRVNSWANVRVIGCTVRGFNTAQGIETFAGTLSVDHSIVMGCGVGISVTNLDPGFGTVRATITNTTIQGNNVATSHGSDTVTVISNSDVTLGLDGIHVESNDSGGPFTASLAIEKCKISQNQNSGVFLNTTSNNQAKVYISDTIFDANSTPVFLGTPGCTAYSFGSNEFANGAPAGGSLTPIALK
jgi:hypothetical protein